ncbi:ABC transporter permease [Nitratireductor rhodophyticola]|uniref:ABC transporter permease n=1 Tax=Nitratireductor rhodophyticola TaxID=2854036 RepID=UPI002AC9CF1A|nr:ABC transporter permease [Nitratireductor rhodophyticola]WPZ14396.1 ABC transporter permease [Nitratireductor rhodophyticola]
MSQKMLRDFGRAIARPATVIVGNWDLLRSMALREIQSRYKGTIGGLFWTVVHPLLMLIIYTFVFSVLFKARWGQEGGADTEYALILFIGLIVFQLFADCVSRAPTLVVSNVNFVKKIIFPLEVLPLSVMGAALLQMLVSLSVWLIAYLIFYGLPPTTALLFPLVLVPLMLFTGGVCWVLSALGVYLRDISQIVGVLVTVLFFMSPIFYPVEMVPDQFLILYQINPITYAVELSRQVLFWGHFPDVGLFLILTAAAWAVASIGLLVFQKSRKGFADVL